MFPRTDSLTEIFTCSPARSRVTEAVSGWTFTTDFAAGRSLAPRVLSISLQGILLSASESTRITSSTRAKFAWMHSTDLSSRPISSPNLRRDSSCLLRISPPRLAGVRTSPP